MARRRRDLLLLFSLCFVLTGVPSFRGSVLSCGFINSSFPVKLLSVNFASSSLLKPRRETTGSELFSGESRRSFGNPFNTPCCFHWELARSATTLELKPNLSLASRSMESRCFATPVDQQPHRISASLETVSQKAAKGLTMFHQALYTLDPSVISSRRYHSSSISAESISHPPTMPLLILIISSPVISRHSQSFTIAAKEKLGFRLLGLSHIGPLCFLCWQKFMISSPTSIRHVKAPFCNSIGPISLMSLRPKFCNRNKLVDCPSSFTLQLTSSAPAATTDRRCHVKLKTPSEVSAPRYQSSSCCGQERTFKTFSFPKERHSTDLYTTKRGLFALCLLGSEDKDMEELGALATVLPSPVSSDGYAISWLMNRHKKVSGRGRRLSLVFASQSTQVSYSQLYTSRPRIKLHQSIIESYLSDPSSVNLISRPVTTGCITPADHLAYQFAISAFLTCKMVAKGSSRLWHFSSPSTHPSRCLGFSFDYVARQSIPTCAMFALKSKLTNPLIFLNQHNALSGRGLHPKLVYTWIHGLAGFSFSRCYLLVLSNLPCLRRLQISSHRERLFSHSCFKESFFTLSFMLKRTVPPPFSSTEIVFKRSKVLKTLRASCVVRSSLLALALDFDFVSIICETFWQKFPVSIYDSYRHFILYWLCTLVSVASVSYSLAKSHPLVTCF